MTPQLFSPPIRWFNQRWTQTRSKLFDSSVAKFLWQTQSSLLICSSINYSEKVARTENYRWNFLPGSSGPFPFQHSCSHPLSFKLWRCSTLPGPATLPPRLQQRHVSLFRIYMNWPQNASNVCVSNFKPRQEAIDPDSLLFRHLRDNQPYCRDSAKEELVVVLRRDRENA